MNHPFVDAGTASVFVSAPFWWGAVSFYGQLLLLALGLVIAGLRIFILVRDVRRKA